MVPEGHKQCTKCGEVKAFAEFRKKVGCRLGLSAECKECGANRDKARYLAKRETILAQRKAYRDQNKEALRESRKEYRQSLAWKAIKKADYLRHKESRNAKRKAYYMANKEATLAYHKVYRQTVKGKAIDKANKHKRRNRGQFAFDMLPTSADFQRWEEHGTTCYLTGGLLLPRNISWDHVVPLHWGGTGDSWNLLPVSHAANSGKKNRLVYFDIATREPRFTTDPCPGGPAWPRIPLTQPTLDEMQIMVDAWKARRAVREAA